MVPAVPAVPAVLLACTNRCRSPPLWRWRRGGLPRLPAGGRQRARPCRPPAWAGALLPPPLLLRTARRVAPPTCTARWYCRCCSLRDNINDVSQLGPLSWRPQLPLLCVFTLLLWWCVVVWSEAEASRQSIKAACGVPPPWPPRMSCVALIRSHTPAWCSSSRPRRRRCGLPGRWWACWGLCWPSWPRRWWCTRPA